MFENVNYTFYTDILKRSSIPDEKTFNNFSLDAFSFLTALLPVITEREKHGLDKAACMIIEEIHRAEKSGTGDGRIQVSQSIEGFSQSFDVSKASTLYDKKMKWVKLFCFINKGIA